MRPESERPGVGQAATAMGHVRAVAEFDPYAPVPAGVAMVLVREIDWLWGELIEGHRSMDQRDNEMLAGLLESLVGAGTKES